MSNVSISTNKLCIGYTANGQRLKANSQNDVVVQRDLTFSLYEGEMVCMLGPNGCGKSTLLRTLAGLQPALSGAFSHQPGEVCGARPHRAPLDGQHDRA